MRRCERCGTTNRETNFSVRAKSWLCLGCYADLGSLGVPYSFERFHAERPGLDGPASKAAFEALPEQLQAEAWASVARKIELERPQEPSRPRTDWREIDSKLRAVAGREYVHRLARTEIPEHDPMICCPLPDHQDDSPSFRVYDDHKWHCFGCNRGGTVYDFAGYTWNLPTRGEGFKEIQRRLRDLFC